ncbi:MAG TPA: RimK/LysX family protein [Candidatus Dormibacteraeota bacterium]|nr:RimK/LysX family protein [Candidatus Dormibacteraeota bacterium]
MKIEKKRIKIGQAEEINFPELKLSAIPARIDTGAQTSAIWATVIDEQDGILGFVLFDSDSPYYSGVMHKTRNYEKRKIVSSIGNIEQRYVVKLLIELKGRKIRASLSLANRSRQVYPMLVGRNVLRGKFVVDVKHGQPIVKKKQQISGKL